MRERRRAIFLDLGRCASGLLNGGAAQNNFETLRKMNELQGRHPRIVGKPKTRRSGNRFSMSLIHDWFEGRRPHIICLGVVSLALLIFAVFCEAYDWKDNDASRSSAISGKTLRTIIVPDYYPYTFVNDQGMPDGFAVDLARAVVQVMDMKLEISVDTWEHAREALENGTIDFLPMMASSPLRRQSFDFSAPHTIAYDAVFVRKGTPKISSLNDLAGKTVIVMNKDAAHDVILATPASDSIKLILVVSLPDGLRLLASGKGDAAIMPKLVGLLLVKKLDITNIEESPDTIESYKRPFSFAVKKGNMASLEALNQGLSIVDAKGQYTDIYDKWFGVLAPLGISWKSVLTYIAGLVAASALVGTVLLVWSLSLKRLVTQRTIMLESEILVRKETEAALRESEERYRGVFENAAIGIDVVDADGRFLQVNSSLAQMLGYTEDDLQNLTICDVTYPDDVEVSRIKYEKMVRGETESYRFEKRYIRKDGDVLWADVSVSPVRGPDGVHVATVGVIADITDRKRAEEAILASEEKYRTIFEESFDGLFVTSPGGRILDMNKKGVVMFGYDTKEEIFSLDLERDVYAHPPDRQRILSMVNAQGSAEYEVVVKKKSGEEMVTHCSLAAVKDEKGVISSYRGIIRDITERRKAEEALQAGEQMLSTILSTSPVGIALTKNRRVAWANDTWKQMFGFDNEQEYLGQDTRMVYPSEEDYDRAGKVLYEDLETGKVAETDTKFRRKDGSLFDAQVRMKALDPLDPTKGTIAAVSDISSRRRAEEVQKRLATAIEQSVELVIITDASRNIQYVNPAFEGISGYTRKEMIGETPKLLKSEEHDKAFYKKMLDAIRRGEPWRGRIISKRKDGTLFHEDVTISPVRDEIGNIINYVDVGHDVSHEVLLQNQLAQAQKMEAVGTLAGGVAHDFNNILTVVMGYSELLLTEKDKQNPAYADLQKINQAAQKGADLVRRLLTFSRKADFKPRPLNLNQQIEQLEKMLTRTIPKMVKIESNLADGLARVHADPTQVDQVLMNLAVNASDAMPDGGKLTIQTANVFLDEEYAQTHLGAKPGEYVVLRVSDTGRGMDKETQDHIFEPFYTTKEAGKGTGLGLAMVYGIVKQHGGYITCYSEPGEGTTFKMYFPVIEMEIDQDVTESAIMPAFGTETILLVDDEESLRDLGERILSSRGYTVLTAANGEEALNVYRKKREDVSLVVLDWIMPEMGGRQCLEEIHNIDPKAKVLVASGLPSGGTAAEASKRGAMGFVGKPYKAKELLKTVRRILDQD